MNDSFVSGNSALVIENLCIKSILFGMFSLMCHLELLQEGAQTGMLVWNSYFFVRFDHVVVWSPFVSPSPSHIYLNDLKKNHGDLLCETLICHLDLAQISVILSLNYSIIYKLKFLFLISVMRFLNVTFGMKPLHA